MLMKECRRLHLLWIRVEQGQSKCHQAFLEMKGWTYFGHPLDKGRARHVFCISRFARPGLYSVCGQELNMERCVTTQFFLYYNSFCWWSRISLKAHDQDRTAVVQALVHQILGSLAFENYRLRVIMSCKNRVLAVCQI